MRPLGSLFAKPGLGEPGCLYDAREACLINEIDLMVVVDFKLGSAPRLGSIENSSKRRVDKRESRPEGQKDDEFFSCVEGTSMVCKSLRR